MTLSWSARVIWIVGVLGCLHTAPVSAHGVEPALRSTRVLFAATPVPPVGEALPAITQTTRARLLVLLAQGNIPGAIEMWKHHTGREAPKVLRAMQAAYGAANQVAGACVRVARDIHAGFRELGGKPQYLKFTPPGNTPYLGWEMKAGVPQSTIQISDTGMHCAVQFKDRVYDAFTGPQGMLFDDYLKRLIAHGGTPVKQVVESL